MRTIQFLLAKEFRQIFRNRALLPVIFVVPVIQLLIMPLAANYEVKNINLSVVDHDHSSYSRQLIASITASGYFRLAGYNNGFTASLQEVETDKADIILEIPAGFEKNLVRENKQSLFIAINAINGTKAGLGGNYLGAIISNFNNSIRLHWQAPARWQPAPVIELRSSNWFNTYLYYPFFMVPGILVVLVTMVCTYMCSLNIVKEKEIGTIEQINVTPIKKYHFILGKLIPFWVIGMFIFTAGLLLVGRLVYGIVPVGSLLLLYAFLSLYLIALLGLGLLISTYADSQQQAMSVAFFFIMIFLLMSGLFTPIESMPGWARTIAACNPVTYFIDVMRMVVLKGSSFTDIRVHFLVIAGFALLFNSWAVLNYKKTS
ncbi:MAG TPA: ABC transporter permease [Chitinophagaceae bacterium]|nr:ABC transporter permease [Chitinophagaceae bacterium]